jgi:hypothetical protein
MSATRHPDGPRVPRFTPDEQAVAVWLSHGVILVVVTLITWRGFGEAPATGFLICEGAIWAMFLLLVPKYDRPAKFVRRYLPEKFRQRPIDDWQEAWYPRAFALAFVLQFIALRSLLLQTGGPIESPFAQLAVAFAVFPPLLANRRRTIGVALVTTVGYYWYLLLEYGFGPGVHRPGTEVFGAVTTLIVGLTVGLAVLDRIDAERGGGEPERRSQPVAP